METKKDKPHNTVSVDFRGCPIRPSIQEVEKLLKCDMQLDFGQCTAIQMHHVRNCVLITFHGGKEIAEDFVKRNNFQHVIVQDKIKYKIPVHVDDGAIEVRVCDLPIHIEQSEVRRQMKTFGEVISARYDKWKNYFGGVYSGVRIVRMHLHRPIPSYAKFEFKTDSGLESYVSRVSYPGQEQTCQHCNKGVHFHISCTEAAKRNTTLTTEKPIKTAHSNNKQAFSSITTNQSPSKIQPVIVPETPTTTETAENETPTPSSEPEADPQPPTEQFTTVKNTKDKITKNTTASSEEDSNEQTPGEAGAEVASPPRKKMVTRANKRQQ